MQLSQHSHHFLGVGGLGERREAAEIQEHDRDLTTGQTGYAIASACADQRGHTGREERSKLLEPPDFTLELAQPPAEHAVALRQLRRHSCHSRRARVPDRPGNRRGLHRCLLPSLSCPPLGKQGVRRV